MKVKNILFPTDFSPASQRALSYAVALAKNTRAKLHLLHAISPMIVPQYEYPLNSTHILDILKKQAESRIKSLAGRAGRFHVSTDPTVSIAEPIVEIGRQIKRTRADVVVMGTHGRNSVEKFFLGSVTEYLLRHSEVPILTVGPASKLREPGQIRNLMIATDFGPGAAEAVSYGLEIAQRTEAKAILVHVIHHMIAVNLEEEYVNALKAGIEAKLDGLLPTGPSLRRRRIEKWVGIGTPHLMILKKAESFHADLIVLNIHGKSLVDRALLGSTAERVIRTATCPVFSIPPAQKAKRNRKP